MGNRPDLGVEPRVFVALEFADQPPTTLVTVPGRAATPEGLHLPDVVVEQIPAAATVD